VENRGGVREKRGGGKTPDRSPGGKNRNARVGRKKRIFLLKSKEERGRYDEEEKGKKGLGAEGGRKETSLSVAGTKKKKGRKQNSSPLEEEKGVTEREGHGQE